MGRLLCLLALACPALAGETVRLGEVEILGLPEAAFVKAEKEKKLVLLWRLLGSLDGGC